MLTQFRAVGFKTLKDVTFKLSPVTVLVGANNVGKSNVAHALEFFGLSIRVGLDQAIDRFRERGHDIFFRGSNNRLFFEATGELAGHQFKYSLGTGYEAFETNGQFKASVVSGQFGFPVPYINTRVSGAPGSGLQHLSRSVDVPLPLRKIASFLANMQVADFSPEKLRAPSLPEPGATLQKNGENLAAVLDVLHTKPSIRKKIDEEVHHALPSVDAVVTVARQGGKKVVAVAEGDSVFDAENLSDGVLLFIALSTVAQMSGGATLIAIEEIERGIHPRRIREIIDQVVRVSRTGSQFVLTTHSPLVLSEFRDHPESVLIVERGNETGTTAKQLTDIEELDEKLRGVSLGDVWYSGVLGGVPTP